jgi:5-(carboxyamino)imidazole ribonucleotide synthase
VSGAVLPGSVGPDGQPAMLGVMGGGQLARMFVHAAQAMGFRTAVLDPDADSPAGRIAHLHLQADYQDTAALQELARCCAAVTTEFENVPARSLAALAEHRPVAPSAEAVAICQQRGEEKAHFLRCGVPCAPHALIDSEADLADVDDALFPGILKTALLGYDGKGQCSIAAPGDLAAAWQGLGRVRCVFEKRLELQREISVIVARAADGQMVHLPVQHNLHRDGILAVTEVTQVTELGAAADSQAAAAIDMAQRVAAAMHYVGVLCVEFFVLRDGTLLANEMAPRPHNSGHYSIDACDVSQFELQVRCMAGLPLVAPRQHSAALMLNLLGDLWLAAGSAAPDWNKVLALPGAHLHLYGKSEARRGRKMGHLTLTAARADTARALALQAAGLLGIAPF